MPWSRKKLETAYCEDLFRLAVERREEYAVLTDVLTWVMEDPLAAKLYQEKYLNLYAHLIEADASITARLYQIVCLPHATEKYAEDSGAEEAHHISKIVSSVPYQGIHIDFHVTDSAMLKKELNNFYGERDAVMEDLRTSGILAVYERSTGKTAAF